MLQIAMLSFAHVHANGYARQVNEHPDTELACIWDDDPVRGREAAERYGVPFIEDMAAVLESDEIDGVVVNSETSKHTAIFLAAAEAGKHIFTEKTLTITTPDAEKVVKAIHESGVEFMISLPSRSRPETLFMKRVLDEGLIGDVTLMRARVAHSAALDRWFTPERHNAWFGDPELAGGGALFDLGCHTTDVMRWFLGEPLSVMAQINNVSGTYEADDNSVVALTFKNKALGILDTSFVHRLGPRPIEIYGTEGYVAQGWPGQGIILESTKLEAQGIQGTIIPRDLPEPAPMPMEQWVDAILHGTEPAITVEDGRNLTELLDAAYTSAREGRAVRFD